MKVNSPLLSCVACGMIGNEIIYQKRSRKTSACRNYPREDSRSDEQLVSRNYFNNALSFWRNDQMSENSHSAWECLRSRHNLPLSGYNFFMRWALLSLNDETDPAVAIYSYEYPGGGYAWLLKDLTTGGLCIDTKMFDVLIWENRTTQTSIYQSVPSVLGLIILPPSHRPAPGSSLSLSCGAQYRSGCLKIGVPPSSTWQGLLDANATWQQLIDGTITWKDFLE